MSEPVAAKRRLQQGLVAAGICAVLLLTFWVRARSAASGKSSTYDEPMHTLGAWVHWHHGDWRINFEDPPLWHYWASMFLGTDALKVNYKSPAWQNMAADWNQQWIWTVETLYHTEGNDGEALVQGARSMMVVLGVALGAVIAWWSYRIAGAVAAVTTVLFFTLDPNFLGHAPLVKNDVATALCTAGLCAAIWRMGIRLTPFNVAGAAVACAAAMTSKFSGVLLAPVYLILLLSIRALVPGAWQVWNRPLTVWWQKLSVAFGVGVAAAVVSFVVIWAAYGFSYGATPDPNIKLNLTSTLQQAATFEAQARAGGRPTEQQQRESILSFIRWHEQRFPDDRRAYPEQAYQLARDTAPWRPPGSVRLGLWMMDNHVLPEGFVHGLLFVQARSYIRGSYLDGQLSVTGFRSYFPLAMAYKTPLATIFGVLGALVVAGWLWFSCRRGSVKRAGSDAGTAAWWWTIACLLVPVAVYMAVSIGTNLNIGFRHVLPIYPLIFVCIGWAVASAARRTYWPAVAGGGVLAGLLAIESLTIAPDYLTFFNAAAGGQRGGLHHLGDSNLDWGQDLKSLAAWYQRPENQSAPLYLSYFGIVDPAFYKLRYLNMPGGYLLNPQVFEPPEAGVIVAISATNLQNIYIPEVHRPIYEKFRKQKPTAVLGGTIYIYDLRR